ncbi:hypothetical protein GJ496_007587 [Pomphorhynchus laevis]|nr:hypothetical protein GJ496_007587 [Pomphorhynchus laevis]
MLCLTIDAQQQQLIGFTIRQLICIITLLLINSNNNNKMLNDAFTFIEKNFTSAEELSTSGGIFESINFSTSDGYPPELIAIYRFIAPPNRKVFLKFDQFHLFDIAPECFNDYLDVYVDVNPELFAVPGPDKLLNRYCGKWNPGQLISVSNSIIMAMFTRDFHVSKGFNGTYNFIDAYPYVRNRAADSHNCLFHYYYEESPHQSVFHSQLYPGTYLPNQKCVHRFIGASDQRVKLAFTDISIFKGFDHCPFDFIDIFDGYDESALLIDRVCGDNKIPREHNYTYYSTKNIITLVFVTHSIEWEDTTTDDNEDKPQRERRGFSGTFEFSNNFIDLSFITGQLIPGTACDQQFIHGSVASRGIFYSPVSKQSEITCKYTFIGHDNQYRVDRINVQVLNISGCSSYQDTNNSVDMCSLIAKRNIVSNSSLLKIYVNPSVKFIAEFSFSSLYDILCNKDKPIFRNSYDKAEIDIPHMTSNKNYLSGLNCSFEFETNTSEILMWQFQKFNLYSGESKCDEDFVTTDLTSYTRSIRHFRHCNGSIFRPLHFNLLAPNSRLKFNIYTNTNAKSTGPDGLRISYRFHSSNLIKRRCKFHYEYQNNKIQINVSQLLLNVISNCLELSFLPGTVEIQRGNQNLMYNPICIIPMHCNELDTLCESNIACLPASVYSLIKSPNKSILVKILSMEDSLAKVSELDSILLKFSRHSVVQTNSQCLSKMKCTVNTTDVNICQSVDNCFLKDTTAQIQQQCSLDTDKDCIDRSIKAGKMTSRSLKALLSTITLVVIIILALIIYLFMSSNGDFRRISKYDKRCMSPKSAVRFLKCEYFMNNSTRNRNTASINIQEIGNIKDYDDIQPRIYKLTDKIHASSYSSIEGEVVVSLV